MLLHQEKESLSPHRPCHHGGHHGHGAGGLLLDALCPHGMSGSEKFAAPSLRHLFGTDNFGRDIFSRVMVGARTTFFISACTVTIGAVVGTLVGALTGYFGGLVDELLMRVNDAVTAFPSILLALVFISLLGFGTYNVFLALGTPSPQLRPCYPGGVRRQREMNYVKNARLMGASHLRDHAGTLLPNTRRTAADAGHRV